MPSFKLYKIFLVLSAFAVSSLLVTSQSLALSPYNLGDTDGDLDVDIFDYNTLLGNFGKTFNNGDYDGNNIVDIFDINTLLSNFGKQYTPAPSPSPSAAPTALIEGVPVCADHDVNTWHALVKRDGSGNIICTYGHEHHDDPNSVNDIFGAPSAWYGGNQTISYPWQTFSFVTPQGVDYPMPTPPSNPDLMENKLKHNGYKWYVKRNLPCVPFDPNTPGRDGCITAYRIQVHSLGTTGDSPVRFHSFSMEAQVNYKGQIGIARGGGWMDTGGLTTLVDGGTKVLCPPVTTNPPTFQCPSGNHGTIRETYSTNVPAPHRAHANPGTAVNWYAAHKGGIQAGPQVEDFGPTNYANPLEQLYYDPRFNANNSKGRIENAAVEGRYSYLNPFKNAQGIINHKGYKNRHGDLTTNCTAANSVDCVPFSYENVQAAAYLFNANAFVPQLNHENHDVMSPVTGKSLITFPN